MGMIDHTPLTPRQHVHLVRALINFAECLGLEVLLEESDDTCLVCARVRDSAGTMGNMWVAPPYDRRPTFFIDFAPAGVSCEPNGKGVWRLFPQSVK